jgi:5-methylcytosine-specific restriction endonuclease McrA
MHRRERDKLRAAGALPGYARNKTAQARFREEVLKRAGGRCEHCGSDEDVRACHVVPLHKGGSYAVDNGILRCWRCDLATDKFARSNAAWRRRLSARSHPPS